jgi:hypothetical protein
MSSESRILLREVERWQQPDALGFHVVAQRGHPPIITRQGRMQLLPRRRPGGDRGIRRHVLKAPHSHRFLVTLSHEGDHDRPLACRADGVRDRDVAQ